MLSSTYQVKMAIKLKFGKQPKRSPRKIDKVAQAVDLAIRGMHRQITLLDTNIQVYTRTHWFTVVKQPDGTVLYYCGIYISNVAFLLNEETGDEVFLASSANEAKHGYEYLIEQFEGGHYNEQIKKHLDSIPPRKRKKVAND